MTPQSCQLEFSQETKIFFSRPCHTEETGAGEHPCTTEPTYSYDGCLLAGMAKVAENISEVIVRRLQQISGVRAVLMGRSGEVHHVWSMIDEWSAPARKQVYAAQKELLSTLRGFELDFYVVAAEDGENPSELVSDIPIVWQRAA